MPHLHRAETWRHTETKARAIVWPTIPGRMTGAAVDFFEYGKRFSFTSRTCASVQDAREHLRGIGYARER